MNYGYGDELVIKLINYSDYHDSKENSLAASAFHSHQQPPQRRIRRAVPGPFSKRSIDTPRMPSGTDVTHMAQWPPRLRIVLQMVSDGF